MSMPYDFYPYQEMNGKRVLKGTGNGRKVWIKMFFLMKYFFTEDNKGNKEKSFVIFVSFCHKTAASFPPSHHFTISPKFTDL